MSIQRFGFCPKIEILDKLKGGRKVSKNGGKCVIMVDLEVTKERDPLL